MHYRREIEVAAAAEATFAYLCDFANAAEWDQGIVEARRLTPAPTAVGSRFEVIALFRGRRQVRVRRHGARGRGADRASRGGGRRRSPTT